MKEKKRVKEKLIIVGIIVVAIVAWVIGYLIKNYKDEQKSKESLAKNTNAWFTECLYIQGDFSYKGSKVIVNDITYHDNHLYVDVAFYNYMHPEKQTTMEELYAAYDAFCSGKDEENFAILEGFVVDQIGSNYSVYTTSVRRNLPEGKVIETVTMEELQDITKKALVDMEQYYEELHQEEQKK